MRCHRTNIQTSCLAYTVGLSFVCFKFEEDHRSVIVLHETRRERHVYGSRVQLTHSSYSCYEVKNCSLSVQVQWRLRLVVVGHFKVRKAVSKFYHL